MAEENDTNTIHYNSLSSQGEQFLINDFEDEDNNKSTKYQSYKGLFARVYTSNYGIKVSLKFKFWLLEINKYRPKLNLWLLGIVFVSIGIYELLDIITSDRFLYPNAFIYIPVTAFGYTLVIACIVFGVVEAPLYFFVFVYSLVSHMFAQPPKFIPADRITGIWYAKGPFFDTVNIDYLTADRKPLTYRLVFIPTIEKLARPTKDFLSCCRDLGWPVKNF